METESGVSLAVAVKTAKDDNKEKYEEKKELLLKEILVMCAIAKQKHANVLAIIGAVTVDPAAVSIVMEIAHTDLQTYLEHHKGFTNRFVPVDRNDATSDEENRKTNTYRKEEYVVNNDLNTLDTFELVLFAYQIANGMKHLASIPCVHRDLKLRNVLITKNKTIRIGDFGLARKHKDRNYYTETKGIIPIHAAPETKENYKFTEKSDVWSFGLCLYDLFTLGTKKLSELSESAEDFSTKHKRLTEPQHCRSDLFEFIELCWEFNPVHRPNFITAVYIFKCELGRFSDNTFNEIEAKLKLELEEQKKLEDWVPKKKLYD
ncbi:hypothetical protein CRE_09129 [Caenorhabditis remanei]|uniref:Protein kinase domain-containing protein n=1 Tax=Caenorhabditis remanei TaxID=31234 RepID=E3LJH1_CAERE|nr:hypothetical protein CRE_09129 [Caenorhabditis remanei]